MVGDIESKSGWVAYNQDTGEVIEIDALAVRHGGKFEKVFVSELANMIDCAGTGTEKVLAHLLKIKTSKNEIAGTQREVATKLDVGVATVSRVFKALSKNGYLRKVRSGTYILNPEVMHYGNMGNKMAILRVWKGLK